MLWLILSVVVIAALVIWYLFRPYSGADAMSRSRAEESARRERLGKRLVRTPEDMQLMGDVRGLTLKVPDRTKACREALENAEKTFLTQDAPPLPMPQCDRSPCNCSYYAIPGRRSGKDRRTGEDRRESLRFDPDKADRRTGTDRRRTGHDPWKGR